MSTRTVQRLNRWWLATDWQSIRRQALTTFLIGLVAGGVGVMVASSL